MLGTLNPEPVVKKKFRWTFNLIERKETEINHEPFFIRLQHRPFEDQELEFLNGKPRVDLSFIKDEEVRKKLEKQVFVICFTDDNKHDTLQTFYRFVSEVYNLEKCDENGKPKEGTLLWDNWGCALTLYDGCGNPLERWTMKEIRPLSINFGDLDYTSCDEVTIEATILYNEVNYKSLSLKEGQAGYDASHRCLEERLKEMYRKLTK